MTTTGDRYRALADEIEATGRDADADVLRSLAREADRLDALVAEGATLLQDLDARLPGLTAATEQLTLL